MEIKILGTCCSKCKTLYQTVQQAVAEIGIQAEIVKEEDLMKIMEYNVMTLPALVIDGKVAAVGQLSLSSVKSILQQAGNENPKCNCGKC